MTPFERSVVEFLEHGNGVLDMAFCEWSLTLTVIHCRFIHDTFTEAHMNQSNGKITAFIHMKYYVFLTKMTKKWM